MKKLLFLLVFIPIVSFGQFDTGNSITNKNLNSYYDDGKKVIEKTWVEDGQAKTLVEVVDSGFSYYINENGVEIGVYLYFVKDYGKYFKVDVSIVNNSDKRIDFIVRDIEVGVNGKVRNKDKYKILTFEDYNKIVKRRQNGNAFLMGFSAGLSNASAGTTYSQSNSYYSGYDSYGYNYSGYANTYTSTYSPALASLQYQQNQQNLNAFDNEQKERMEYINDGYLKNHTIFPNTTLQGYFLIPFNRKVSDIDILFKIENMIFDFSNDKFH